MSVDILLKKIIQYRLFGNPVIN